jgi:hypothetical protein
LTYLPAAARAIEVVGRRSRDRWVVYLGSYGDQHNEEEHQEEEDSELPH